MSAPIVDAHSHVSAHEFDGDRDEVLAGAWAAGLVVVVEAGDDLASSAAAVALAAREPRVHHEMLMSLTRVEFPWLQRMLESSLGGGGKRVRPAIALLAGRLGDCGLERLVLCLRLQRGGGVRGWGRDGLGTGARRVLMSTTRSYPSADRGVDKAAGSHLQSASGFHHRRGRLEAPA